MKCSDWSFRLPLMLSGLLCLAVDNAASNAASPSDTPLTVVVMDPLAAPLSCPCVEGYAQRDYDQLGKYLSDKLGRPVDVFYSESLTAALKKKTQGKADLIIGKRSVVEHDARTAKLTATPVAALTDKEGSVTQVGLIIVPSADPAKSVADLKGYRIIFGPAESEEKHGAALALLDKHGVAAPAKLETCEGCSDGASMILEAGKDSRGAAVISSYAKPLLEGCGTVKKGDLRVIGTTDPTPFIVAFISERVTGASRESLREAIMGVGTDPALCVALESQLGFIPVKDAASVAKKK